MAWIDLIVFLGQCNVAHPCELKEIYEKPSDISTVLMSSAYGIDYVVLGMDWRPQGLRPPTSLQTLLQFEMNLPPSYHLVVATCT